MTLLLALLIFSLGFFLFCCQVVFHRRDVEWNQALQLRMFSSQNSNNNDKGQTPPTQ